MTTATDAPRAATPWHYWLVAAISVFWNGFGGYDYTMSHVQGDAYYHQMKMTDAQIAVLHAYPVWMHAIWAIGVWGSVAGSILLLLRSRWAVHAFAVSTLGAGGALIYNLVAPGVAAVMSPAMPAVIVVICLLFVWYARRMANKGVLR